MAKFVASFYDTEIAMLEHEIIQESDILENHTEGMMWYLAGVHDMAQKVIEKIQEKEVY